MFLASTESEDRSPWGDFWFSPVPYIAGLTPVTADTALQLTAVFACVRVLAEGRATLPFTLARLGADGGKTPVRDHYLYRLFAQRPNEYQNPFEFAEMLQGHLCLRGNGYCEILADGAGEATDLLPLHPDSVKAEIANNGRDYRYRVTNPDGTYRYLARSDVFHLRAFSQDGITGLSPIGACKAAIELGLSAQAYGARFFENDAKPGGGWIEYPGNFKDAESRKKFRESWQERQGGRNRGKTAVLEFGMKYHELTVNNEEAQFLETRKMQVSEIARLFRVPPHLIGDLERSTNNNIEQQSLDYIMHTLTPWLARWEAAIRSTFLVGTDDEDLEIEFPVTALLRGDSTARANYYASGITNGWMVRNEARIAEGMNPLDGLSEPLQPLNMVTPEQQRAQLEQQRQQQAQPGDTAKGDGAARDRAQALAIAAAERIARKEAHAAQVAIAKRAAGDDLALRDAYQAHARFVRDALGVPQEAANRYCNAQLASIEEMAAHMSFEDLESLARTRLERLALTGAL